ncbi:glycosyltransferase [Nocardioides sp. zg-1228]|uniref:glycosyltransferase n=1 Tax=Nocardioides sp. zg-1228 TaxID=2763008 RepID=UPI001642D7EE|nr:glycosyltransferase [Nocardioides sp. zg-1228]MBC2931435.1 glycosyltransferase [Nocardioides sp. zg-1228]QSF57049.1 glycosyltransferase [Nocardioides sp. zg-1228]
MSHAPMPRPPEPSTARVVEVRVAPVPLDRLTPLLAPERVGELGRHVAAVRRLLGGRTVWNINSTARGGGVAEMLHGLVAYAAGAGLTVRWLTVGGGPEFFAVTKRLHNRLHGSPGDGGALDAAARATYDATLAAQEQQVLDLVQPGDVVLLHDPQTAGLAQVLRRRGVWVVWRCHVGVDEHDQWTREAWAFLRDLVEPAHACVFSREQFAPDWVDRRWLRIIPPSLDPFSPKNVGLGAEEIDALVHREEMVVEGGPVPSRDARVVLQVSRWDRLKDMGGVLDAFSRHLDALPSDVHLVLAGPETTGVADDPEAVEVLAACREQWQSLPAAARERSHLLSVPMDDLDENARTINALQRWATVGIQKSLAEGFGLTVTEPMWKGRPVVASAVGGIRDQVEDGVCGLLLDDPRDGEALVGALASLLADPERCERMGRAAHLRVRDHYLADRHLIQYAELFGQLLESGEA